MGCKDCGKKRPNIGPVENERFYRFAMSPYAGIEVRTWGDYTRTQASLIGEWVSRMLQLAILDRGEPDGK